MEECNFRHAYLIIAHNNFRQLQTLIHLLDDERNDIYLHIDQKAQAFSPKMLHTDFSKLTLIDRLSVSWGGESLIQCELNLLKAALPGKYRYYHLISGADLPLKSQDHIHHFFLEQDGAEFMEFDTISNESQLFFERVRYYFPLQEWAGSSGRWLRRPLMALGWGLVSLQKFLHIRRPDIVPVYKGAQWFSITHNLANYVVTREKLIKKQFFCGWCADEFFLQSIAMASPYRNNIHSNYLRAIDWQRGDPYTYRKEDVPELLASPNFWGRKFNENVDQEAIDLIAAHLTK